MSVREQRQRRFKYTRYVRDVENTDQGSDYESREEMKEIFGMSHGQIIKIRPLGHLDRFLVIPNDSQNPNEILVYTRES